MQHNTLDFFSIFNCQNNNNPQSASTVMLQLLANYLHIIRLPSDYRLIFCGFRTQKKDFPWPLRLHNLLALRTIKLNFHHPTKVSKQRAKTGATSVDFLQCWSIFFTTFQLKNVYINCYDLMRPLLLSHKICNYEVQVSKIMHHHHHQHEPPPPPLTDTCCYYTILQYWVQRKCLKAKIIIYVITGRHYLLSETRQFIVKHLYM